MQAVLKFHDAIEFCMRAVIDEHTVNHDKNAEFAQLQKSINNHFSPKQQLPLTSQIDFINNARGKIKHHASVPSEEDAKRCQVYARDFVEQVTKEFLAIDFGSISRLILVENEKIRMLLEEAEKQLQGLDYLEALIHIKKAFYVARPSDHVYVSRDPFFSGFFLTSDLGELVNVTSLKDAITKLADKITDIEDNVVSVMMGIDPIEFKRFEQITPELVFTVNGGCNIYWDYSNTPTESMVVEALDYVVSITLMWQAKGVAAYHPDRHGALLQRRPQYKSVRTEKWHYYE